VCVKSTQQYQIGVRPAEPLADPRGQTIQHRTKTSFLPLSVSKQPAIMPGQSYGLEDGSCSYKDFSESRNNRFSTPEQAAKNRIQHPSNVLHFFNAPLEVTEENFFEVGVVKPICHDIGFSWAHLGHSKRKGGGRFFSSWLWLERAEA
jgi:hypothetical protein